MSDGETQVHHQIAWVAFQHAFEHRDGFLVALLDEQAGAAIKSSNRCVI